MEQLKSLGKWRKFTSLQEVHIIEQMYANMISLLQNNAGLVHGIQLINVEFDRFKMVYPKNKNNISFELPNWVKSLAPETLNLERF